MMSPDGVLGTVPEERVAEALAEGHRIMTSDDMRALYNRLFMEHALFQDQRKQARAKLTRKARR